MKQAQTAIAVYRQDIEPTLQRREQIVLDGLRDYGSEYPTSYELTAHLRELGLVQDVNGVRPRLTSLFEKAKVEHGDKRKCRITGKVALTWRIAQPRVPLPEPIPQRLFT